MVLGVNAAKIEYIVVNKGQQKWLLETLKTSIVVSAHNNSLELWI